MPLEKELVKACQEGELSSVRKLLKMGANPNNSSNTSYALGQALQNGFYDITKLLLKYGAFPDQESLNLASKAQDSRIARELYLYAHPNEDKPASPNDFSTVLSEIAIALWRWSPHVRRNIYDESILGGLGHNWSFGLCWQEFHSPEFISTLLDTFGICPMEDIGNSAFDSFNQSDTKSAVLMTTEALPLYKKSQSVLRSGPWKQAIQYYSKNVAAKVNIFLMAKDEVPAFIGRRLIEEKTDFTLLGLADSSDTPFKPNGLIKSDILDSMKRAVSPFYSKDNV